MNASLYTGSVMPLRRTRSRELGSNKTLIAAKQADLFDVPTFDVMPALIDSRGRQPLILIGCGQSKRKVESPAGSMYTSERFKLAKAIAETLAARFLILSAKHGVLNPSKLIEPYNVDLKTLTAVEKRRWIGKVISSMKGAPEATSILILAERAYADPIAAALKVARPDLEIFTPLSSVDDQFCLAWHQQALHGSRRISDLKVLYRLIDKARDVGRSFELRDIRNQKLPERGVYIFVDRSERNFELNLGRVVRIGTHAISEGSKSQLRTRLRNHLGQMDGSGNHRGSIFRLHVGRALLERGAKAKDLRTWGVGQDAPKGVRRKELALEKSVSRYLGQLEVVVLPVLDAPNKFSLRATIEKQLIALYSEGLHTIDRPSKRWLGRRSPSHLIADSGLWNLRDVGAVYYPDGAGSVTHISTLMDWSI